MPIKSYNDILAQLGGEVYRQTPFWGEIQTATSTLLTNSALGIQAMAIWTMTALPSSVPFTIPTRIQASSSTASHALLLARLINLGSLDISSNVFTDGDPMPTVTEGGTRVLPSPVLVEAITALNSTPGNLQLTYVDQDGNTAESNTAQALTASSVIRSCAFATLNNPDWGVRDLTNAQRTSGTSPTGTLKFWGVIPVSFMPVAPGAVQRGAIDNLITASPNIVRIPSAATFGVFSIGSTATKAVVGSIFFMGDST